MNKIKIAIAGVGNCASALVQGVSYYKEHEHEEVLGLISQKIGGYKIQDFEFVAAFDVDKRKVGKSLERAIFEKPNCVGHMGFDVKPIGIEVQMGVILDGVSDHMHTYDENRSFRVSDKNSVDIVKVLKESDADILVNYMPVGSEKAARYYAQCALDAGVGFVNCIPVFITTDVEWNKKFLAAKLPIIGDDIKSQVGATIVHRVLTRLFGDRGYDMTKTYQLNFAGNTDFLNMKNQDRLESKRKSKTQAVTSQLDHKVENENVYVGPSDYVPWQNDNKICMIRMEGFGFAAAPIELDLKLSVCDSQNSAGVVTDAIRYAKLAMDQGISGSLVGPSAYLMKSPPVQLRDSEALELCQKIAKDGYPPLQELKPELRQLIFSNE